jgi:hypothetical protein
MYASFLGIRKPCYRCAYKTSISVSESGYMKIEGFLAQRVDFGSGQGLSDGETAGVAALR